MKFINLFAISLTALFFAACATTDESPSTEADTGSVADEPSVLLMDQYKAGDIPGYLD
jgi:hypothetical protein